MEEEGEEEEEEVVAHFVPAVQHHGMVNGEMENDGKENKEAGVNTTLHLAQDLVLFWERMRGGAVTEGGGEGEAEHVVEVGGDGEEVEGS